MRYVIAAIFLLAGCAGDLDQDTRGTIKDSDLTPSDRARLCDSGVPYKELSKRDLARVANWHDAYKKTLAMFMSGDTSGGMKRLQPYVAVGYPAALAMAGSSLIDDSDESNDGQAIRYLHRSANHGCGPAQMVLATLYATGRGVPKNMVQALKWSILANKIAEVDLLKIGSKAAGILDADMFLVRRQSDAIYTASSDEDLATAAKLVADFMITPYIP